MECGHILGLKSKTNALAHTHPKKHYDRKISGRKKYELKIIKINNIRKEMKAINK